MLPQEVGVAPIAWQPQEPTNTGDG
jgi:hypothetical protein